MQLFSPGRDRFEFIETDEPQVINAIAVPANEPLSIDELINAAIGECNKLPERFKIYTEQTRELHRRLANGRLHLAVVGEFNRGKSTFINGLIGAQILPTSVLPITAVPTRIIFGPDLSCTVRFFNKKPDILVRASHEKISEVLLQYVAEENNPNNQHCVDSVEVCVPSPLLENGTVLIDTPGFGSTYLHNTKTALDALAGCDAALFLLSADPPMTQTEVEFLKQVVRHVPRLFFILNKVDLLTSMQLEQVDRFISDILMKNFHHSEKPHLFHICARRAENAKKQTSSDPQWALSGMEAIKQDILTFMAREKYFTLSQALNDKLKETIGTIVDLLRKEQNDISAPLIRFNKERDALAQEHTAIRKTMEKELSLITVEKKAVIKFLDEQLSAGKLKLIRQIREAISILLDSSSCSADSLKSVTIALNNIIPEALNAYKTGLLAHLNRPFKKALILHGKEANSIAQSVYSCIAGIDVPPEGTISEKLDTIELDIDELQPIADKAAALTIALQWNDFFYGRQNRLKRLHERYDHRFDELLQTYFFNFSKQVRQRLDALFTSLHDLLASEYKRLSDQLEKVMKHKEEAIAGTIEKNNRAATSLNTQIESFQRISAQLH